MATFIPNLTDVVPAPLLYQPDLDFAIKAGMYAAQQYNAALQQIQKIYGKYAAAPILNPDVDKKRNDYIQSLNKYIDKFAGLDLRDPNVISTFASLFEPLAKDTEVMNGLNVTETYYNEKARINSLKATIGIVDYTEKGKRDYRIYDPEIDKAYDSMALYYSQLKSGDPLLKTFKIKKDLTAIDINRMANDYFIEYLKAHGEKGAGGVETIIFDPSTGKTYNINEIPPDTINRPVIMRASASYAAGQTMVGATPVVSSTQTTQQSGQATQQTTQTSQVRLQPTTQAVIQSQGVSSAQATAYMGVSAFAVQTRGGEQQVIPLYKYFSNIVAQNPEVIKAKQDQIEAQIWNTYAATGFDEAKTFRIIRDAFVEPTLNELHEIRKKYNSLTYALKTEEEKAAQNITERIIGEQYENIALNAVGALEIKTLLDEYNKIKTKREQTGEIANEIGEKIKQLEDLQKSNATHIITREGFLKGIESLSKNIAMIALDYDMMRFSESAAMNIFEQSALSLGSNIGRMSPIHAPSPHSGGFGSGSTNTDIPSTRVESLKIGDNEIKTPYTASIPANNPSVLNAFNLLTTVNGIPTISEEAVFNHTKTEIEANGLKLTQLKNEHLESNKALKEIAINNAQTYAQTKVGDDVNKQNINMHVTYVYKYGNTLTTSPISNQKPNETYAVIVKTQATGPEKPSFRVYKVEQKQ